MLLCFPQTDGQRVPGQVQASRLLRRTMPPHPYTLGYEGFDIDVFVGRAREAGVRTIVDARELLQSTSVRLRVPLWRVVSPVLTPV